MFLLLLITTRDGVQEHMKELQNQSDFSGWDLKVQRCVDHAGQWVGDRRSLQKGGIYRVSGGPPRIVVFEVKSNGPETDVLRDRIEILLHERPPSTLEAVPTTHDVGVEMVTASFRGFEPLLATQYKARKSFLEFNILDIMSFADEQNV